jgi:hypothetical protein
MSDQEPKHEQRKNMADHPHWWTIILSIVALIVSIFSYAESHRSRLLNEELNRPLVRVKGVDVNGPVVAPAQVNGPRQENSYSLRIRNSGKSFATNIKLTFRAQLDDTREGNNLARFSDFRNATSISEPIGDLAPDDEYSFSFWASVLKDPPTIPFGDHRVSMVSLYTKGEIAYTNSINGARYTESFCFADAGSQGHFLRCPPYAPEHEKA